MKREDYCIYSSESASFQKAVDPADARVQVLGMDKSFFKDCMVTESGWYLEDCFEPEMVKHESGEVLMLLGSDKSHPDELNANVEIWIENDKITMNKCCAVFIPAGAAHGKMKITNLKAPIAYYSVQTTTDTYKAVAAEATAAAGSFANNMCERFEPSNGYVPAAPAGVLTLLVWIDSGRIESAPYAEAVWFNCSTTEGPEAHTHSYGEFLSFIGTDPSNPADLGCTIEFYLDGQRIDIIESTLMFIPAGVSHGPFYIHDMVRPILHTSGYAGGDYQRES